MRMHQQTFPSDLLSRLSKLLAELITNAAAAAIEQLASEEARAVEAEDFDAAAGLSSRLDGLKQSLAATEQALQRAEDDCARLVGYKTLGNY